MAAAARRRITLNSISCRGVNSPIPFQKPPLYVAVSLAGRRHKTSLDREGGENPEWERPAIGFDLDGGTDGPPLLLQFEVKAQVPLLGNKLVGTACVPVADLDAPDGVPRHVSYQVRSPDGKPNGTLHFSYIISRAAAEQVPPAALPVTVTRDFPPQPYPVYYAPPVSSPAYPTLTNLVPSSSYPPLPSVSRSEYPAPPLPDLVPKSSYPPPPVSNSASPALPNLVPASSSYTPPAPSMSTLADLKVSNSAMNNTFTPPSAVPSSPYPGMPMPNSTYPALPYSPPPPPSAPPLQDSVLSYPPPGTQHSKGVSGACYPRPPVTSRSEQASYPPPGTRHPEEAAPRVPHYYPPPGTRYT